MAMPEAQCMKYPVRPGHREALVDWMKRLRGRSTELVAALSEGRVLAEAVFLERSNAGDYLVIYTSAQDLEASFEALSNSTSPLIQEFNRLLAESVDVEKAVSLEFLYHTP
jgi:Family of unknown function (DUF6176)